MQQPKLRFQRGPQSGGEKEGTGEGRGSGEEASPRAQKIGGVGVGRRRALSSPPCEREEGRG